VSTTAKKWVPGVPILSTITLQPCGKCQHSATAHPREGNLWRTQTGIPSLC